MSPTCFIAGHLCRLAVAASWLFGVLPAVGAEIPRPFLPPYVYPLPAASIVTGDINGDGRMDALTGSTPGNPGSVAVYIQNASGKFDPPVQYAVPSADVIALGDVNGDGRPDIVTSSPFFLFNVHVLLQNPDGTFAAPITLPQSNGARSLHVSDLDNDGKMEIVLISGTTPPNSISVIRQSSASGTGFAPTVTYSLDGSPWDSVLVDLNGDQRLDIVFSIAFSNVNAAFGVSYQQPDGSFGPVIKYESSDAFNIGAIGIQDMNDDGLPDVVVSSPFVGTLGIFLQQPDGTFVETNGLAGANNAVPVAVADFDGNGRMDVVAAIDGYSRFALWEQDKLGQFGPAKVYEVPVIRGLGATRYGLQGLAAADVSGDGKPDLLVADMLEGLIVYYNSFGTVPIADLHMRVQYEPQPALIGSTTTITVDVINDGPSAVSAVALANFLPPLLTYVKNDRGCGLVQLAVICDLGALASGASTRVQITAVPERSQAPGISAYENVAFVEADQIDYFPDNNVDVTRLAISNPFAGQFRFEADRMEVSEGAGTINLKVLREGGSADGVFVNFNVSDITTKGAVDWQGISSGFLVWGNGDSAPKFITLSIIDDSLSEGDESLVVSLSNPTLGSLGTPARMTLVIKDDDGPPSSSPPSNSGGGGSSGGGGCTLARGKASETGDPMLPVLALAAMLGILRRKRTGLSYRSQDSDR